MKHKVNILLSIFLVLAFASCNISDQAFSFVQLCDPQLGMGGYEHDTETFRQAVSQINDMDVDFAIICGDLVHHASDSTYADFLGIVADFEIPCYMVPGNHDVGKIADDSSLAYYRRTIGEDYFSFRHKGISFICTNSQLWKADIGEESQKHDAWFRETLESKKRKERGMVIGHYPVYIDDPLEEEAYFNFPPEKRETLLNLMLDNNIVAYLSGHKHEVIINNYHNLQLVTGESTSKNFDKRPMGFRKWDVQKDTVIHSFISVADIQ